MRRTRSRRYRDFGLAQASRDLFKAHGTEFCRAGSINREPGYIALRDAARDSPVSVGESHIVRAHMLSVPRIVALNVHNGSLPAYRGVFATFWEIHNREPAGSVTVHTMAPKVDDGPILASARAPFQNPFELLFCDDVEKSIRGEPSGAGVARLRHLLRRTTEDIYQVRPVRCEILEAAHSTSGVGLHSNYAPRVRIGAERALSFEAGWDPGCGPCKRPVRAHRRDRAYATQSLHARVAMSRPRGRYGWGEPVTARVDKTPLSPVRPDIRKSTSPRPYRRRENQQR